MDFAVVTNEWAWAIPKGGHLRIVVSSERGGMGVFERLAISWEDAACVIVAVLAWMVASILSCPQVSANFVSKAGVEITAAIPLLGPIMGLIEEDDREFQDDDLGLCSLPDARLVGPPSLALSQITPPQSFSLCALTLAQHPLRC
jgi:hypothetical protein